MKRLVFATLIFASLFSTAAKDKNNTLTKDEKKAGWQLLWDGKTLEGWTSASDKKNIEDGWYIKDGELCTVKYTGDSKTVADMRTVKRYTNFILCLQVKITPGANSGIKYFIQAGKNVGCEFQVLDNELHPDAKLGINGNRTVGSLYDMIPADPSKVNFTVGEWNDVKIVVNGNNVEHWLNGEKVVEYTRNNQMFNALVKCSKFANYDGFGNFTDGYILLQNHKDEVFYRNIKIREL